PHEQGKNQRREKLEQFSHCSITYLFRFIYTAGKKCRIRKSIDTQHAVSICQTSPQLQIPFQWEADTSDRCRPDIYVVLSLGLLLDSIALVVVIALVHHNNAPHHLFHPFPLFPDDHIPPLGLPISPDHPRR